MPFKSNSLKNSVKVYAWVIALAPAIAVSHAAAFDLALSLLP